MLHYMLQYPHVSSSVRLWGGFAWSRMSDGPPGCDARSGLELCRPASVFVDGEARCMATPRRSPLGEETGERGYVCEHRRLGRAGWGVRLRLGGGGGPHRLPEEVPGAGGEPHLASARGRGGKAGLPGGPGA